MKEPIRILNLFSIMNRGGAETMCMNLYRNIDRTKVQFDFLVYYSEKGDYDDEIESLGGHIYRIPHLKNIFAHINGAKKFFKDHSEYKIVYNHLGETGGFICKEAKKYRINNRIYHCHGESDNLFGKGFKLFVNNLIKNNLVKYTINNSTKYITCGKKAAKVFEDNKKEYVFLKNGINLDNYVFNLDIRNKVREELSLQGKLVIGHIGRIDFNKNQSFLIDIFSELVKIEPNAVLLLVGDGILRQELENKVKNLGLQDKVMFTGVRSDVNELLQGMDVFVFPSIKEGLPVACIEAQASGLPTIISDGFDPETVITKDCSILSLNDSPKLWAEKIMEYKDFQRYDTSDILRQAGYDIKETSKFMEQFYLNLYNN